jgi:hypothetical protein
VGLSLSLGVGTVAFAGQTTVRHRHRTIGRLTAKASRSWSMVPSRDPFGHWEGSRGFESPLSVNESQVVAVLRENRQKAPMWRRSDHFIGTREGLQVAFTSSQVDFLPVRGLSTSDKGRANWRQTRSIIVATPIPPPIHIVISAADLFWRSSSSSTVPISIPPVAPSG